MGLTNRRAKKPDWRAGFANEMEAQMFDDIGIFIERVGGRLSPAAFVDFRGAFEKWASFTPGWECIVIERAQGVPLPRRKPKGAN